ncbi:MAG TPA: glycosyltransferase family 2 protein [Thermoguttaceae bacterium]|nr:glycosyltransferase family 2 protein [Thermoguttaceae bacterium]
MEAKVHFFTVSTEVVGGSFYSGEGGRKDTSAEKSPSDLSAGGFQGLTGESWSEWEASTSTFWVEKGDKRFVFEADRVSAQDGQFRKDEGESEAYGPKENIPYQVTILLPAYNEQEAIAHVLQEVVWAMASTKIHYEILVVDDGSTDQTAEIAEAFARQCQDCPVRVVRLPENRGAGAARKVGIRHARGDVVVMLDADGSYPADCIPELLRYFPSYDQVNGARSSEQGRWPWLRGPAKWLIRKLACYLTGKNIPDLNTGMKAFKRGAMLPWLWVVPDGFSCVTTMTLAFLTNGYAVKYVPIAYRPRIGRSKFHPIRDTAAYVSTVLRMVLYFRPLRIFLPLAFLILALGILMSLGSFLGVGAVQPVGMMLLAVGWMTGMVGLLAEACAAHHRR